MTGWVFGRSAAGRGDLVGYRARPHSGVIDLATDRRLSRRGFLGRSARPRGLILDPGAFYILVGREIGVDPPDYAAEMAPYLAMVGRVPCPLRGLFRPGFGHGAAGHGRAASEVRCHEAPLRCWNMGGSSAGWSMSAWPRGPERLYGTGIASNYQGQG